MISQDVNSRTWNGHSDAWAHARGRNWARQNRGSVATWVVESAQVAVPLADSRGTV